MIITTIEQGKKEIERLYAQSITAAHSMLSAQNNEEWNIANNKHYELRLERFEIQKQIQKIKLNNIKSSAKNN